MSPTSTAGRLRWGVLGAANIAVRSVIPAMLSSPSAEVVALGSRDPERAGRLANDLGVPRVHTGYDALLEDPEVEAVYIPLPNALHCEWTVRAAEAGKHVLCEKPMALSIDECRRMLDACAAHGVLFLEALMYRLHPQHQRIRQIVESGLIGDVTLVRATFGFSTVGRDWAGNVRFNRALGGGALYDVGVYAIDSARFILGNEPVAITGRCRIDPRYGVDVTGAAVLEFPGGVIAEVSGSFEAAAGGHYEIIGTRGRAIVEDAYALGNGRPVRVRWQAGERRGEESFPSIDQYRLEVDAFAEAVRGTAPPPWSADAGMGNVAVIEKILSDYPAR